MIRRRNIIFTHNKELKVMIKERAQCLGLDIPEYIKYIIIKDIIENDTVKNKFK